MCLLMALDAAGSSRRAVHVAETSHNVRYILYVVKCTQHDGTLVIFAALLPLTAAYEQHVYAYI